MSGKTEKVIDWKEPDDLYEKWKDYIDKDVSSQQFFKDLIEQSIQLHNPRYMGHQVAVPLPVTALASMAGSLLNNGMAIYEMGPVASVLEKWIISHFAGLIGNKDSDGYLTSGGTLATLTALLSARQAMLKNDVWENGQEEKLAIMVSEQAHYSVDKAARIMGLGSQGVIKVPVDEEFKMQTDQLEPLFKRAENDGLKVIALVANGCSTSTGTYDDLAAISKFCDSKNIWFHLDAAHGGGVIYSPKYKHLLNGIEKADSVIIDLHKMLMGPALSTLVLFKNSDDSYKTFSQKAQYLWENEQDKEWYNYAKRTLECTKLMMSIRFYAIIQAYGIEIFNEYVTRQYDLAREFAKLIQMKSDFELATEPMSNIVCFRYAPQNVADLNELNGRIRKKSLENGDYYIVQTALNGDIYLRVTLMNPFTETTHLKSLLEEITKIAGKIE
ncbi:MAG: aminotransferase class I/II-fold pyridoxal phosphate-dependent enzyme [Bacteroidetes bacterium]|nr:aminotransferase class I/II-fold pyridoxal phosphate-dependent enzyme [Bacteroidota bacterium]